MTTSALVFATSRRTESDHRAPRVGSGCSSPPTRAAFVEEMDIVREPNSTHATDLSSEHVFVERYRPIDPREGKRSLGCWVGGDPPEVATSPPLVPSGCSSLARRRNPASPRTRPTLQREAADQMDALALSANTKQKPCAPRWWRRAVMR